MTVAPCPGSVVASRGRASYSYRVTETVQRAAWRDSWAEWRDSRQARVAGSLLSWFLFSLAFTMLYLVITSIIAVGSPCAAVGPDDIATPCSNAAERLAPLAIVMGLVAVAVALWLAQGFGTPLVVWAWPIVFCGIGSLFLLALLATGEVSALIIGVVLLIMGAVPLYMELRAGAQRAFLGAVNSRGDYFIEAAHARPSLLSNSRRSRLRPIAPKPIDWITSFALLGVSSGTGYVLGRVLFFGV